MRRNGRIGILRHRHSVLAEVRVWIGHFLSSLSYLLSFSPSLSQTARYRLKYYLKEPLNPKQTCRNNIYRRTRCQKVHPLVLLNTCVMQHLPPCKTTFTIYPEYIAVGTHDFRRSSCRSRKRASFVQTSSSKVKRRSYARNEVEVRP